MLYDLNIEKGLIIEETNKIEAKMERLKIPKRVIDIIKKSVLWILWIKEIK